MGEKWKDFPCDCKIGEEDFESENYLRNLEGVFIEIGGPTEGGYVFVDIEKIGKKIYVSNIFFGCPKWRNQEEIALFGKVDFLADGRYLPFTNNSLGAIFVSYLGNLMAKNDFYDGRYNDEELRKKVIKEAVRTLKSGGLLVWRGGWEEDFDFACSLGLEIVWILIKSKKCKGSFNGIFRKS